MNPAQATREEKELHPERFCPKKRCLWKTEKTGGGFCPRHAPNAVMLTREQYALLTVNWIGKKVPKTPAHPDGYDTTTVNAHSRFPYHTMKAFIELSEPDPAIRKLAIQKLAQATSGRRWTQVGEVRNIIRRAKGEIDGHNDNRSYDARCASA